MSKRKQRRKYIYVQLNDEKQFTKYVLPGQQVKVAPKISINGQTIEVEKVNYLNNNLISGRVPQIHTFI